MGPQCLTIVSCGLAQLALHLRLFTPVRSPTRPSRIVIFSMVSGCSRPQLWSAADLTYPGTWANLARWGDASPARRGGQGRQSGQPDGGQAASLLHLIAVS